MRKLLDLEAMIGTAFINSRGRQDRRIQIVGEKKNDGKGALDDPVDIEKDSARQKDKKASQGEKTVAKFFAHGKKHCAGCEPRAIGIFFDGISDPGTLYFSQTSKACSCRTFR